MILTLFLLGLIIGSFLNVLVYRLRDAETLLGRSFCRHCKHQIRFYDNVPLISFVLLRGACRDCETQISWQYPALELFTGLMFALAGYFFFSPESLLSGIELLWLLLVISCLIVIAAYDLRHMEIPIMMLIISALLTYAFLIASFVLSSDAFFDSRLWSGISGGVAVGSFFFLLVWMSRERWMGWGDVWLGLLAGSIVGLSLALPMLTLSFGVGAVIGMALIISSKKELKSQIPFAPFLVFGTLSTIFLAEAFPHFFQFFIL